MKHPDGGYGAGGAAVNTLLELLAAVGRVGVGPLIVRAVACGSGFAAVYLALPESLRGSGLVVLAVLLALGSAIGVDSPWVSGLEFIAVILWFGTTTIYRTGIDAPQLLGLAVALYLHHSACALAATLPADAVLAPRLLQRWAVRTGGVLVVSVLLGSVVLVLPELLGRSSVVLVPLLGLATLLVAGFFLVRLARRT